MSGASEPGTTGGPGQSRDAEVRRGRIRRRVIYHGHVQGVFFRATAAELAQNFAVAGFVRNRSDGTVELEVEGLVGAVEGLLAAVAAHYRPNISRTEIADVPLQKGERDFRVRY